MDNTEWHIEEKQSEYLRGYRYGNEGKYPRPADMPNEWEAGYSDGRSDFLNSINPKSEWKQY